MSISGRLKKELQGAIDLYVSFREKRPRKIKTVDIKLPRAVVCIGYMEYAGYRTTHGDKTVLYQHNFASGSRPLLCASADGRQLLLIGGRFKFTERGIVDIDAKGREIDDPAHGAEM